MCRMIRRRLRLRLLRRGKVLFGGFGDLGGLGCRCGLFECWGLVVETSFVVVRVRWRGFCEGFVVGFGFVEAWSWVCIGVKLVF